MFRTNMLKIFAAGLALTLATPALAQTAAPRPVPVAPGDGNDLLGQAVAAYADKRFDDAAPLFRQSADLGNAQAQYMTGVLYLLGQGVAQDNTKAAVWLDLAATQGVADAQFNLSVLYATGRGVPADKIKAADLLAKAATQGLPEAQYNLGIAYENGDGVASAPDQAAKWYQKAAAQNYAPAETSLAFLYLAGKGVPQDKDAGLRWLTKAGEAGEPYAQSALGNLYETGQGIVGRDAARARIWYQKAAAQGDATAQTRLAALAEP